MFVLRLVLPFVFALGAAGAERPNLLWLTSEDHGPDLGCYGDAYAVTPHVDHLAQSGLRYTRVWSNAPVCAPARTALLSGLFPSSTGSEHMRSLVPWPKGLPVYTRLLRDAGYFCTNNDKTDYNLAPPDDVWDASSNSAHWRDRPAGRPFFAIFNSMKSHESQVRRRPHELQHDPAHAPLPAYHPDTPETRRDWAQYYDQVTAADADAGARLAELAAAGLTDDTIIFFYADHGAGLPRHKRSPCDSGLHVPLIVFIPEKFKELRPPDYQPGGTSDRLVSFVDFAPTVLSLAGIAPPAWMQGRAFLGKHQQRAPDFLHGFRGRMDERIDLVRSVTDGRFVYIRNYLPHRIPGQHIAYMFEMPTVRVWRALHDAGQLTPEQDAFWKPKPPEELYDLTTDPEEVHNLATSPAHAAVKQRLQGAQQEHARWIRDLGFLPEGELFTRAPGVAPYDFARDAAVYPFERIFAAAERASLGATDDVTQLLAEMRDADSAVRFWSVIGLRLRDSGGGAAGRDALRTALDDASPFVQIAAAEALVFHADSDFDAAGRALDLLGARANPAENDMFVVEAALNAIDALGPKAAVLWPQVATYRPSSSTPDARYDGDVAKLLEHLRNSLPGVPAP